MRQFLRTRLLLLATFLILLIGVVSCSSQPSATQAPANNPTAAPESSVNLSVAIPNIMSGVFTDSLIKTFEDSHPGVVISLVKLDANIPPAAADLDKHLAAVQQYAGSADVLYVASANYLNNASSISEEATRAGYFLDLKPFVDADSTVNTDDFFPALWQSYQWDKGVWALPFAADPYVLTYLPSAFDSAKLAYPSDGWTESDLVNAVQQLSLKDANGKVTQAGLDIYGGLTAFALRGLLKNSIIDSSAIPNTPKFNTPEVTTLLKDWLKLDQQGMIAADINKAPLGIGPAISIALPSGNAEKRAGTRLPGGQAPLDVQAFAVSNGTQFPEQAYILAEWLTTRGEIANNIVASTPARKSLLGTSASNIVPFTLNITPDVQALVTKAISKAIPVAELRFTDYLVSAYNQVKSTGADPQVALQNAEDAAIKNAQAAAKTKDTLTFAVQTPIPNLNLPAGKIALKVAVLQPQITNEQAWNQLDDQFTASDPQVAKVILDSYFDLTASDVLGTALLNYDCVYASFNAVTPDRLPELINFDPLLAADPNFDKADMLGNTLSQVTLDNKVWMLPSDLSPYVLKYDSDRFSQDGIPLPGPTWTIQQFADALKTLKGDSTGQPGFVPTNTFGTYLLQLITAYGGTPIDYRTNPITISFSDPATQDAIQQVVTLAKSGELKYRPLFASGMDVAYQPEPSTIRQALLTAFSLESLIGTPQDSSTAHVKLTLFPSGSKSSAVTFNLGGFYISANAQNPQACYRYISKATHNPALFASMPARHSLLDDPTLAATQGADTVALYKQIAMLLDDPHTVTYPGLSLGTASLQGRVQLMPELELFKALDSVILNNTDLTATLKDAESSAKAFEACATSLPVFDVTNVDSQRAYLNGFAQCATKADPAMVPFFAAIKTS